VNNRAVIPAALAFIAVFLAAINLRAGISSLAPVLGDALAAFGSGGSIAGVITAMPGLFFAVVGLVAVPVATRLGLSRTLLVGMVIALVGLAARPWVGAMWLFLVLTALIVAGIALANVLLPAWIKSHGGRHVVALMAVYSAILSLSGAIGPLSILLFTGPGAWRWALFLWAGFSAAQVAVWAVVAARAGFDFPSVSSPTPGAGTPAGLKSLWRSRTAVALMLFFGLQSMHAYVQMGWLPKILLDYGHPAETASVALALVGGINAVGGFAIPFVLDRLDRIYLLPLIFAAIMATGYLGIWFTDAAVPLLWAALLGIGGYCFPTAIALIPARTRAPLITARLSGFVQPYGYLIAAAGPFLVGVAYQITLDWSLILAALGASCLLMVAIGFFAARGGDIDDEIAVQV